MELSDFLQIILLFVLTVMMISLLSRRNAKADEFPESFKIFGPTSRTIGGPGNFKGRCGDELDIFKGPGNHVISVTLENTGNCDLRLGFHNAFLMPTEDFSTVVPAGATITRCGHVTRFKDGGKPYSLSTHDRVSVKCMTSESDQSI